jgi:hypothetical protein
MQEETKDLCYWAAQLYHTDRIPSDIIYDRILNSKSRLKEVAQAKQLVGYMLYNHLGFTLQQVAYELNLTNHSTRGDMDFLSFFNYLMLSFSTGLASLFFLVISLILIV